MQVLKQSLEHQRKELNDCRAEITSLKVHIEGSHLGNNLVISDVNNVQSESLEKYKEEMKKLQMENEWLKEKNIRSPEPGNFVGSEKENLQINDKVIEIHEDQEYKELAVLSDIAPSFTLSDFTSKLLSSACCPTFCSETFFIFLKALFVFAGLNNSGNVSSCLSAY